MWNWPDLSKIRTAEDLVEAFPDRFTDWAMRLSAKQFCVLSLDELMWAQAFEQGHQGLKMISPEWKIACRCKLTGYPLSALLYFQILNNRLLLECTAWSWTACLAEETGSKPCKQQVFDNTDVIEFKDD